MTDNTQPEALRLAAEVLDWMPTSDTQRALWDRHQKALVVVKAALVEAQQPATHVQNPAEIEHVAGDVSKNRPGSNMAQQPAPSAAAPVGEAPLPLLVRDIATDLGTTPIRVCTALAQLGFGGHSVNMAVTPRMAQSLRAHFASPTPQADSAPASLAGPMQFGGCPECGSRTCVARQCSRTVSHAAQAVPGVQWQCGPQASGFGQQPAPSAAPNRICNTCQGTGIVKGLHNWIGGGTREEKCWNCHEAPQPSPTPQADSQPAPDQRQQLDAYYSLLDAMGWESKRQHISPETWAADLLRDATAYRAARAPADSVQDLQPVHDAVTIDLLNERVAYLERKLKEADSVLEDADPIRALIAQHAAILDQNESAYFELCYHRATGWMAWITDKPLCMPPVVNPDRKVLAHGQGDTAYEACRDAAHKQGGL